MPLKYGMENQPKLQLLAKKPKKRKLEGQELPTSSLHGIQVQSNPKPSTLNTKDQSLSCHLEWDHFKEKNSHVGKKW